jgi:diguanylate cyclase (GGDEF)-like protein
MAPRGQAETAIDFAERALAGARRCGDAETLFAALNNLAAIHYDNYVDEPVDKPGREAALDTAVASAREALAVARVSQNPHRETYALNSLARPLLALGRHDEAATVLQRARTIAETHAYGFLYVIALVLVARGLRLSGRPTEAIEAYRSVIATRDLEVVPESEAHQALYELFKQRGEFELALSHHEKFRSLRTSELNARADWQGKLLMVKYELETAQQQAHRARLDAEMHRVRADELDRAVHTDPLTGAYNRRFFEAHLPRLLQRAAEQSLALSAAMLDVDYFKRINDRFGHPMGDRVLLELAQILKSMVRASDDVVRMGGEEFLVVYVDTPLAVASAGCERLRNRVETHPWHEIEETLQVTVSIGVARWDGAESPDEWIARIDSALYQAKSSGRNCVVPAD